MDAGLRRLYWIVLVVNRRSRAGEVVDLIDLDIERKGHVVPNKLEPMMVEQMINVALRASEEIVDTYDVPTISEQSLTEMRAEKAGSPGNQYACFKMHTPEFPLDCPITACHIGRQFPTSKIRMQSRSPANGPIQAHLLIPRSPSRRPRSRRGKVSAKPNIEPRPFEAANPWASQLQRY
jgi:hypothetical protein